MRLDERVEIVLSIVVCHLFACLDALRGIDVDTVLRDTNLRIRSTSVVHVARNVLAGTAQNRFSILQIKQVPTANLVRDFTADKLPPVFDNKPFCRNILDGKYPKPCYTSPNAERKNRRTGKRMRHSAEESWRRQVYTTVEDIRQAWWFFNE